MNSDEKFSTAKLFTAELMKAADQDKISSAVSQQIALLGSRSRYERINLNLKLGRFEPLFAKVKPLTILIVAFSHLILLFFTRNTVSCSSGAWSISPVSLEIVLIVTRTAAGSQSTSRARP